MVGVCVCVSMCGNGAEGVPDRSALLEVAVAGPRMVALITASVDELPVAAQLLLKAAAIALTRFGGSPQTAGFEPRRKQLSAIHPSLTLTLTLSSTQTGL